MPNRFHCVVLPALLVAASALCAAEGVTTPGADATLKSLALSCGPVSPGFSAAKTNYVVHVAHGVSSVTVAPVANQPAASVAVNGTAIDGGQSSSPIPLEVGRKIISIDVTAPGGQTKIRYTVKAFRAYPTPTWVKVQDSGAFAPRDSAGELVFKDRMWLFGGYTPEVVNDVWNSNGGAAWTKAGVLPNAAGVNIPVSFVFDGKMWVTTNDGQLYSSPDGAVWTLVTDQAPWRGRYAAGGVAFGGKMWVMGGLKAGALFNDIWSSTDGVHWTLETESAPWSKRQLFSMAAAFADKMWVIGGGVTIYHPFKAYNDVWSSPDGLNWTKVIDEAPWPPRIWSTAAVYRNRLWVLGGFRSEPAWTNFNDVWYSADGAHWHELVTETIWSPRHELSAYVFAGKLWVVAGNAWPLMNDVWYLEIPGLVFLTQPVVEEFATAQYSYQARADFNESGREIRYRLVEGPAWLAVDSKTGLVRGTPGVPGSFPVSIEAYDDAGETARQSFTLHVIPVG